MADLDPFYTTGTASVTAGSTAVTGQGTGWTTAGLRVGDLFGASGIWVPIVTINSPTSLTLAYGWPGAPRSSNPYWIQRVSDGSRVIAASSALLANLVPNLIALGQAQGAANKVPFFTGPGALDLADLTPQARTLLASALLSVDGNNLVTPAAARLTGGAVTQSTTDATAGRLLRVGDFGVGGLAPLIVDASVTDSSIAPGVYRYATPGSSGGPPGASFGILYRARRVASGGETQILVVDAGTGTLSGSIHVQTRTSGAWTAWRRLDTVRGSKAGGTYVLYPDGSQECRHRLTLTQASIDHVRSAWPFPAAFAAAPEVFITPLLTSAVGYGENGLTRGDWGIAGHISTSPSQTFVDIYRSAGAPAIPAGATIDVSVSAKGLQP